MEQANRCQSSKPGANHPIYSFHFLRSTIWTQYSPGHFYIKASLLALGHSSRDLGQWPLPVEISEPGGGNS